MHRAKVFTPPDPVIYELSFNAYKGMGVEQACKGVAVIAGEQLVHVTNLCM